MDPSLPLGDLESRLPDAPFTRSTSGVPRAALERMLETGSVVRLLRGVYAAADLPLTVPVRAAAVALVAPRDAVVVDRTAAWVHGADVDALPVPLDVLTHGPVRRLAGRDVVPLHGLRVTTPLRTALDTGRLLAPGPALATMDALMRLDGFPHAALLAELPRFAGQRGIAQLRVLTAQVDARAASPAESVLRLHWHDAALPTATPGLVVAAGHRLVRLALGVAGRRFGAVLAAQVPADDLVHLEGAGWRIAVLSGARVLTCEPIVLTRHLEREFHQYLLAEVEGWC